MNLELSEYDAERDALFDQLEVDPWLTDLTRAVLNEG